MAREWQREFVGLSRFMPRLRLALLVTCMSVLAATYLACGGDAPPERSSPAVTASPTANASEIPAQPSPSATEVAPPANPSGAVPPAPTETPGAIAAEEITTTPAMPPPPPPASTKPPQRVTSPILDFVFESPLTIPAGSTVTWTNEDIAPHTVTATDGSFDSGTFDPGMSYSRLFADPGQIALYCTIHPFMVATLIVE